MTSSVVEDISLLSCTSAAFVLETESQEAAEADSPLSPQYYQALNL